MSCKLHPWFMPTARRRQKPHPRFKPSVRYHALLPNEPHQLQPRFTPSFGHPYSSQASPSEILMGTLQTRPTRYRYPTRPDSLTSLTPRRVFLCLLQPQQRPAQREEATTTATSTPSVTPASTMSPSTNRTLPVRPVHPAPRRARRPLRLPHTTHTSLASCSLSNGRHSARKQ